MTLKGVRTSGAFGLFDRPIPETGERLRKALCRAKELRLQQSNPTTRKYPLNNLRRLFSNILGLDVIFSPRLISCYRNSKMPNSRLPTRKVWEISPVWKVAPPKAVEKADKLCSLLHTIATDGWRANICHDLTRLAINVWQMSFKAFSGLCRKILSKIYKSARDGSSIKSPDTLRRFSTLSRNPVANATCVLRYENRKVGGDSYENGLSTLPNLGIRAEMLNTRWYKTHVRRMVSAKSGNRQR